MRKNVKKFLSTLIVLAMVLSMSAVFNVSAAFGAEADDLKEINLFVGDGLYSVNKTYLETSSGAAGTSWSSKDEAIAVVNGKGEVTALAEGETIVSAVVDGVVESWKIVVQEMPDTVLPSYQPATKPPSNTYPQNDSVHDPCIVYVESENLYYLICTNTRNVRSSPDLVNWTNLYTIPTSASVTANLHVTSTTNYTSVGFWAPVIRYNPYMERYCIYFSASNSYSTGRGIGNKASAIGLMILEPVEGQPYSLSLNNWKDGGIVVKSYDAWRGPAWPPQYTLNVPHGRFQFGPNNRLSSEFGPNAIDACVFFDKTGERLFMLYGSFFEGTFVIELDPATGLPFDQATLDPADPNYAVRYNTGVCVARRGGSYASAQPLDDRRIIDGIYIQTGIEGPTMFYNPDTDYYYLMVSYDDLASDYNVRLARSENPWGPFYDYNGMNMVTYSPENVDRLDPRTIFTNDDIELDPYFEPNPALQALGEDGMLKHETLSFDKNVGTKILAPYQFSGSQQWLGMGHNEVFRAADGEWTICSHAKNPQRLHVRKLLWTEDGWPMASPARYAGERITDPIDATRVVGRFELSVFTRWTREGAASLVAGTFANLNRDGTITSANAAFNGSWVMYGTNNINVTVNNVTYKGQAALGWDWDNWDDVEIVFAGLSDDGTMLWGKGGSAQNYTALVDKSKLIEKIQESELLLNYPNKYTTESYDALNDAYVSAKAVYANADAVQDDVDGAVIALQDAIDSLVLYKAELYELLYYADSNILYFGHKYKPDSFSAFFDAYLAAKAVADDDDATHGDVDYAYETLSGAIDNLIALTSASADAVVEKLSGNKNNLTITISAKYEDGTALVFTKTYSIDNNAEGVYELNGFLVYVNTKGNTKIFDIGIIN